MTLNSIANTLKDLMENNINDINKLQNKIGINKFLWKICSIFKYIIMSILKLIYIYIINII